MSSLAPRAHSSLSRALHPRHQYILSSISHLSLESSQTTQNRPIRHYSTSLGFTWKGTRYRYAAQAPTRHHAVERRRQCRELNARHRMTTVQHRFSHTSKTFRGFHTYFVTHLPSSSLHPESGLRHGLPRDASTPHTPTPGSSPALSPPNMTTRDLTVVRIPLRRAKHHFGSSTARGSRPYNEDADQAGTLEIPSFAKRAPQSVIRQKPGEPKPAESALGDPQIFYFGVFDGHGGSECSHFLRDELHGYIEEASDLLGQQSTLSKHTGAVSGPGVGGSSGELTARESTSSNKPEDGPVKDKEDTSEVWRTGKATKIQRELLNEYQKTIGGYFRRFNPEHFNLTEEPSELEPPSIESVLMYAFLRADLDFVAAQARKPDPDDSRVSDTPLNNDEVLGVPHAPPSGQGIAGGKTRFKGGSTASIALISTPTPAPFWHPSAHSSLVVAHVGDTRILICDTATGTGHPLTSDHHPNTPQEERRLRRYAPAGSMVSGDSFGEQRIAGLANSRAFGDMRSKRIGVSAEPEFTRVEMEPAQYSFLVLVSDGVSGTLSDQEVVDVIKEARTPEEGARKVVDYATEVSSNGDNATCQVIRLGGWERRSEGGVGSLGTKEMRDMRRTEAMDPRRGKR